MRQTITRSRLLIIDDDPAVCDFLAAVAEGLQLESVEATSATEALTIIDNFKPNIIILDLCLPDMDGIELISILAPKKCDAAIILMSGMDQRTLQSVHALGTDRQLTMLGALHKPMRVESIEALIKPYLASLNNRENPIVSRLEPINESSDFFGLGLRYSPEILSQVGSAPVVSLRAQPSLGLDDGDCIEEEAFSYFATPKGIVNTLFKSLLQQLLHDLASWSTDGFVPNVTLGVSAALLENTHLPRLLGGLLQAYNTDADRVTLELFESDCNDLNARTQEVLSRLRLKGLKIRARVLDDGGTALSNIDHLPIDQFAVNLGATTAMSKQDIEKEFLYSSLNSVANRKNIEVYAVEVNSLRALKLAQQCRFNALRDAEVYAPLSAHDVLLAHHNGLFANHKLDLLLPA